MLLVKGWLFPGWVVSNPAGGDRNHEDPESVPVLRSPSRSRSVLWTLCFVCGLLTWAPQGIKTAMAAELAVTDPRHFTKSPERAPRPLDARLGRPAPAPPNSIPSSNLLYGPDDRRFSDFRYDRKLSRLCREGRFLQVRDRLFIVQLDGQVYGAAIGGHWALRDPNGAALPGFLYAIHRQHTGRCEVRRIGPFAGR